MNSAIPTDDKIADAARQILDEQASALYLSRLGQDLRAKFGPGFKIALGTRSLGEFVSEHLGDAYEVWGKGPYKRVGVHGSADEDVSPKPRLRYRKAAWDAFSVPLNSESKRWINLGPPLKYYDGEEAPATDNAVEVRPDFIIGDGHPRQERAGAVAASIRRWAEENRIPLDRLEDHAPPDPAVRAPRTSGVPESLDALRRMISTIPEDERARYSLPLNLLGRLLQVP